MRYTGLILTLFSCIAVCEIWVSERARLPHLRRSDVVRLHLLKERTKKSALRLKYPDIVEYSLNIDGKNVTIFLERNRELLGKTYTLTYYTKDGMKVESPSSLDHCYYHGHVRNVKSSSVSVSLCSGMQGFVRTENQVYLIEPLENSVEGRHAVYKQERLRTKRAALVYINDTVYNFRPRLSGVHNQNMKEMTLFGTQRYVKLVLVIDYKEYITLGNLKNVERKMLAVTNHVNKLYHPFNIIVVLVGLEVWSLGDQIEVSPTAADTLRDFIIWRKNNLLKRKKHDNAHLVTTVKFEESVAGVAYFNAMCSDYSGAVNQDFSDDFTAVAVVIAHEMGHNFGMEHDGTYCHCQRTSPNQGCIMGAKLGKVFPEAFSNCSSMELKEFLQKYDTSCLLTVPKEDEIYGASICGNGLLEKGEECDCGKVEECRNPCCNAITCRLSEGSACANGECCKNCQLKQAGTVCRRIANECDLEDYCTGNSPHCPKDKYKLNGYPCQNNEGYCYKGQCPTHREHCKKLWGPDAEVAADVCYENNANGISCAYLKQCTREHMMCGKIYCKGVNQYAVNQIIYILSMGMIKCYLAVNPFSTKEIGMVPTGAKCGTNKVCYNGFCLYINTNETTSCSEKCNNHGDCDSEGQCHCYPGWVPPYCEQPQLENSGTSTLIGIVIGSLGFMVLVCVCIMVMMCCEQRHGPVT